MLARALFTRTWRRCVASYVHGASSTPLLYETLGGRLRRAVQSVPDRELVVFDHQNIRKTYSQVYTEARVLACALLELGLEPGDRVGVWGPNYYEWITCQFATAMAGLIQVTINPFYKVDELRFAMKKVGMRAIITPQKFRHADYYRSLTEVIPAMASQKPGVGSVQCRDLPQLEHVIVFGEEKTLRGAWRYEDLLTGVGSNSEALLNEIERKIDVDAPVFIQYTSGTTGFPKAATLTHHNIINNAYFVGLRNRYHIGDHSICVPPPLYHCFASVLGVLSSLVHQQTCVFPDAWFNPRRSLEVAAKEKCTWVYGTPTMFIDMLAQLEQLKGTIDLSALDGCIIGAAPVSPELCKQLVSEMDLQSIQVYYGCTELSPIVSASLLEMNVEDRIKNSGFVLDHTEIRIADESGRTVERGINGELLARGYMTMSGYYNDEERTKKDIGKDRWFRTGDLARMNSDGSVSIVGRIKDMIIRGGENIYPTEIEQFLVKIDGVADAQVIGVPDRRFGEVVCAWIRPKEGASHITPEFIIKQCKEKIADFKAPKYVLVKQEHEFPLTATGKVKKDDLRSLSKRELGLEQTTEPFTASS